MSITRLAITNTRVTAVFVVAMIFAGLGAYFDMPQQMDPGFTVRVVQIVTVFPGASSERVEELVTDPIEQSAKSLPELDFINSTSRQGVSIVEVNVREEFTNVRPIFDSLRRKIDEARPKLPQGVIGPTINDELGDTYPMIFSMSGDGFSDREMHDTAKTIRDELLRIKGVGKVSILGEQEERIFIEYSHTRLAQLGLSPGMLTGLLRSRNIIQPGGQLDIGSEVIAVEPGGNFNSVEELGKMLVPLPAGGVVHLNDITQIRRDYIDPPKGIVSVNGRPAVAFAVSMSDGNNLVELGDVVRKFFDDLQVRYPHGIDFERTYFQPKEVRQKVDEFLDSVIQAVIIVLLVMMLFLGIRTGIIVAALIPTAMVITMYFLGLLGETVNQMTLASLIIALGLLVDNAIVVTETIMVRLSEGEERLSAAVGACKELQGPLLISSLTTAAAFLPIALAESNVGEYTSALFTVVTTTLLVSWVLAITMTPLLAYLFLKVKPSPDQPGRLSQGYERVLRTVLRNRVVSLVAVIVAFAASMPLWGLVPQIFFPAQESPFFMAEITLPPGASIKETKRMSAEIDAFMERELKDKEVTSWTTFLGETPPPFTLGYQPKPSKGGYCELMVHTKDYESAAPAMRKLRHFVLERFPDAFSYIRPLATGPPVKKPIQVRISGPETDKLFNIVDSVRDIVSKTEGAHNVDHNWGAWSKKITIDVNEDQARNAAVSNEDVANAAQAFLTGIEPTQYREGDDSIPVVLRSIASERRDLDRMRDLTVYSQQTNRTVPLSQVASVGLIWQPSSILRRDGYRTVTVEADVQDGYNAIAVFSAIQPHLEKEAANWDIGYRWEFGGEIESSVKANQSIADKLPIGGLIILMLLVMQFNSVRKTSIVLSTIVLALIGVAIGLVVMRSYFGFMTLLGVISLAGIVINNAIVLLDRIRIEIEDNGLEPGEATVIAAQQRVRPILLTTATTVASLIPLYVAGGSMWRPMAVAIMFGLLFSTALTLFVVPLLYTLLFRVRMMPAVAAPAMAVPAPAPEQVEEE